MRTVHWLFVVSTLLFVSGIALVIAGARTIRQGGAAPASAPPTTTMTTVATTRQIMKGIAFPAATAVFNAVGTTVSRRGVEERAPRNDAEWEAVGDSAAALIESGNLMLIAGRAIDKGDWVTMTQAMIDASAQVLRATQEKNADKVLEFGGAINESCDNCHRKYQRAS